MSVTRARGELSTHGSGDQVSQLVWSHLKIVIVPTECRVCGRKESWRAERSDVGGFQIFIGSDVERDAFNLERLITKKSKIIRFRLAKLIPLCFQGYLSSTEEKNKAQ